MYLFAKKGFKNACRSFISKCIGKDMQKESIFFRNNLRVYSYKNNFIKVFCFLIKPAFTIFHLKTKLSLRGSSSV